MLTYTSSYTRFSMQRRTGKAQAHIAAPVQNANGMGSDAQKTSRLNQRSLGVTHRIWLIIALFLFLLAFTQFALPSTHPAPRRDLFSNAHLTPKNYLNDSGAGPNPFPFCPVFGPGDDIGAKYGALTLSQSRVHLGSGARVQRVINRALHGQPVTISIIGGSGTPASLFCIHR